MSHSLTDNNPDAFRSVGRTAISVRQREGVFWASSSMRDVEADLASAFECNLNIMITGERGVGKTSIAERICRRGRRAGGCCVIARSPGVLDSLERLERALEDASIIQIEGAERMSPAIQARLLEFIERQTVGRTVMIDVRFITVSHTNLFELAQCDEFSEPLFYRLNPIHLIIPPLRDRPEDIPVLLRYFMSLPAHASLPFLSRAAWHRIVTYEWPGNVGELQGVAEALMSRGEGRLLDLDDLPPDLWPPTDS
jgi:two-component system, NtrC family, response regulator HydG